MARGVDEISIEEIRQRYLEKGEPVSARILTGLQRDSRQGVQRLYAVLKKRFERDREERLRLELRRVMRDCKSASFVVTVFLERVVKRLQKSFLPALTGKDMRCTPEGPRRSSASRCSGVP